MSQEFLSRKHIHLSISNLLKKMKLQFPAMSCKFKTDPKYIVVHSPAGLMYSDEHAGLQYSNWLHLYMTEHLNVSISKVTLVYHM